MADTIIKELARIQSELKAPKGQWNDFSKFHYRSCEDILSAVKPLLKGCALTFEESIEQIGGRIYVKAEAVLTNGSEGVRAQGYAREPESKKGMDESQITGSASSYARKYALNALFAIDDTKDADAADNRAEAKKQAPAPQQAPKAQAKPVQSKIKPVIDPQGTIVSEPQSVTEYFDALYQALYSNAPEAAAYWEANQDTADNYMRAAMKKGGDTQDNINRLYQLCVDLAAQSTQAAE